MIPAASIDRILKKRLSAAARHDDRKREIIELLSDEQPHKSRTVEQSYQQCAWWEGCYYCQDTQQDWHQVKCFL